MFCNVTIDGTSFGSQTDLNGMYNLTQFLLETTQW